MNKHLQQIATDYALMAHDSLVTELDRKDAAIAELVEGLKGLLFDETWASEVKAKELIAKHDIPKDGL